MCVGDSTGSTKERAGGCSHSVKQGHTKSEIISTFLGTLEEAEDINQGMEMTKEENGQDLRDGAGRRCPCGDARKN